MNSSKRQNSGKSTFGIKFARSGEIAAPVNPKEQENVRSDFLYSKYSSLLDHEGSVLSQFAHIPSRRLALASM